MIIRNAMLSRPHYSTQVEYHCASQVPLFASLSPSQRSQLCTALLPLHVKAGTAVVQAGDAGNTFYVVEAGTCTVHSTQGQVSQLRNLSFKPWDS